ncbi:MAG: transcription-repair coupling factor [Bacilli bacterium]
MNNIIDIFKKDKVVNEIKNKYNTSNYSLLITNTTMNHNYLLTYLAFLESNKFIVFVASNLYKATLAYEAFCQLAGSENVNFYAVDEVVATEVLAVSSEFKFERLYTLDSILNNNKKIIVTHTSALTRPLIDKQIIINNIIKIRDNDIIDISMIVKVLMRSGYKKVPLTSSIGEFSVRGEIIDIFPVNSDIPFRIDLFDDEVEYIKTFDILTQKTINKVDEIEIFPINELIYDSGEEIISKIKSECKENIPDHVLNDFEDIINYNNLERVHKYIKYFTDKTETLLSYLDDKIVFYEEIKRIEENHKKTVLEITSYIESKLNPKGLRVTYIGDYNDIFDNAINKVFLTEFKQTISGVMFTEIINLNGYMVIDYQNDVRNLIQDLKVTKKTIIIAPSNNQALNLLEETLESHEIDFIKCSNTQEIKQDRINLILTFNALSVGFIDGFEVISDHNIYKKFKIKRAKYRSAYQNTQRINSKDDLKPGEFVVHFDYGIGQYLGIKTIELQEVKNDYIMIKFENIELYIPVENINLIEKYQGTEGTVPKLTTIGTNDWEKKKKRVREKLESIAKELIEIQAVRQEKMGYKYSADDYIQEEFENDFEYMETEDQDKAINDIKKDMEAGLIVDRLVCGDVGYGKTEVAMRIALKTVLNGKQVSYLAPTTILSRQHYYSFKERFDKFGIKIELLNRFVSPKKQDEIIQKLKNQEIDIVIGTHRLLNEEIKYKNLGLLIVDEEQRFGVIHKEKIKKYKNNINVLTLTATPIPRTLQMAIMGVRQLSLIETPPQNRYPVQTYVVESNDIVVKEAIYRELGRDGQVFYLHNRISTLEKTYRKLKRLVPEAKILIAHGRMDKDQLEEAIQSFIDKEFDVLLCTTIIETGIDIPNTNTLIVDMADRLGLSQMYQIRGRVGRSDRVSYAYFMYDEDKVLTSMSTKRLNAIKEFTTLGSGYKIALRDLAIRGAGDILGQEQSGFIDSVGLEMYMKMLNEAVNKLQGIKEQETTPQKYNIEVSKHISDDYVTDDDIKIYIHKKITSIKNSEDKRILIEELVDRFGKLSNEIFIYIDKVYLESLLNQASIEEIKETPTNVKIVFSAARSQTIDGSYLFKKAYEISKDFSFEYKGKKIILYLTKTKKEWIKKVIKLIESIL